MSVQGDSSVLFPGRGNLDPPDPRIHLQWWLFNSEDNTTHDPPMMNFFLSIHKRLCLSPYSKG